PAFSLICYPLFFFFCFSRHLRYLHSFPTRRSSDLICLLTGKPASAQRKQWAVAASLCKAQPAAVMGGRRGASHSEAATGVFLFRDRKSTRLNSSHVAISYAVFCLKKKKEKKKKTQK